MSKEAAASPGGLPPYPHSWIGLILAMAALAVGAGFAAMLVTHYVLTRPLDLTQAVAKRADAIEALLLNNRVPATSIERTPARPKSDDGAVWSQEDFNVVLPDSVNARAIGGLVARQMEREGVFVTPLIESGSQTGLSLSLKSRTFARVRLTHSLNPGVPAAQHPPQDHPAQAEESPGAMTTTELPAGPLAAIEPVEHVAEPGNEAVATPASPKLAIILDDGGYGGDVTEKILAFPPSLTLSILPDTPKGKDTAARAAELGFEIMLHMPMENEDPSLRFESQLEVDMSGETILELTQRALAQVPGAVGVNNHTGSKFTANPKAMALFMEVVSTLPLYFIDSRTTADTRALKMAEAFKVRSAAHDLFLDHESDPDRIRSRFDQVVGIAREKGHAIAIGHFRPNTVEVLAEKLPGLEAQGVQLVHASELAN